MQSNQQNPSSTSGPQPTQPGAGKSQTQPYSRPGYNKPAKSRVVIQTTYDVSPSSKDTYNLLVEVRVFEDGAPLSGQEVALKEGLNDLDRNVLDTSGEIYLRATGKMTDLEQRLALRIILTGKSEDKNLVVTIPAKKKITMSPKDITVQTQLALDLPANLCHPSFAVHVSENGKDCVNQMVELMMGVTSLSQLPTDNYGKVVFNAKVSLEDVEKVFHFWFRLVGLTDIKYESITVPAKEAKQKEDNDAETMQLLSHSKKGEFRVLVRIIKNRAIGLKTPFTIFYKGEKIDETTDEKGEYLFKVPGKISAGNSELLQAMVSGIEDPGKIELRYRKINKCRFKKYTKNWFLRTNNGRAMLLLYLTAIFFSLALLFGTGNGVLNARTFRQDNGLSQQEEIHNRVIGDISPDKKIQAITGTPGNSFGPFCWKAFWVCLIALCIYGPLSWREEIQEAIAEQMESIFHRSSTQTHDPLWERLAKEVGIFHSVKKRTPVNVVVNSEQPKAADSNIAPPENIARDSQAGGIKTTFGQMLQASFIAEIAVELVPKILKKIFQK